jgi:hypothetical protein
MKFPKNIRVLRKSQADRSVHGGESVKKIDGFHVRPAIPAGLPRARIGVLRGPERQDPVARRRTRKNRAARGAAWRSRLKAKAGVR